MTTVRSEGRGLRDDSDNPADIALAISTWLPRADRRDVISDAAAAFAREVTTRLQPGTVRAARHYVTRIAPFASFWETHGLPLVVESLFTVANIDYYVERYVPVTHVHNRSSYASQLNQVRRLLLNQPKEQKTWQGAGNRYVGASEPFSLTDVNRMFSFAANLSTAVTRRRVKAILTFGLGCGTDSTDIRNLTGTDVTRAADGTVLVNIRVSGTRPRQVPVLARYEQAAWELAQEAGDRLLLHTTKPDAIIRPDNIISNAWVQNRSGVPQPNLLRLRATWLVDLMAAGVRLDVIGQATGVKIVQLDRYLQYLPTLPAEQAQAALRGARA
jgi:hypothetical protein